MDYLAAFSTQLITSKVEYKKPHLKVFVTPSNEEEGIYKMLVTNIRNMAKISKIEWDAIKKRYNNACIICGKTEKSVGTLQQAHIKARSRGGTQVVPMCSNHHGMYDKGKFTDAQLEKIGLTREQYARVLPKSGGKSSAKKNDSSDPDTNVPKTITEREFEKLNEAIRDTFWSQGPRLKNNRRR